MADPRTAPFAPVEHFNEREHRRLLALRANAALTPVLSSLTAGQLLRWDGEAWVNDGEEGTWTPTLTTDGTDFDSVTYSSIRGGRYVRIGDLVFVSGRMITTAVTVGSASGNVRIGGLPFPAIADSTIFSIDVLAVSNAVSWASNQPSTAILVQGTSQIALYGRATADGADTTTVVADVNTGFNHNQVRFSGWYTAA